MESITTLPFSLQTPLEEAIAADGEWLEGIKWGKPRPGHPEGKVAYHIREVLGNVERLYGDSDDYTKLRLIALIHDTFKYKAKLSVPRQSHGYVARQFAERYIDDEAVLEVIEQHDEAYKAWRLMSQGEAREEAERRARALIARLGDHIELFMHFYLCDNQTGDKSSEHYEWFRGLVAGGW